jgi:adenylate cyclase
MASLIQQYRGRVVDDPGDNLLAEFPSVVHAVQCAVTIQRTLATRNAVLPRHRQMVFRMGLHVGDIVVEQERIYGAAVNLAARLSVAEAAVCVFHRMSTL